MYVEIMMTNFSETVIDEMMIIRLDMDSRPVLEITLTTDAVPRFF